MKVQLEPPENAGQATKAQRWERLRAAAARMGYRVVVADHLRGTQFALMSPAERVIYVPPSLRPDEGEQPS